MVSLVQRVLPAALLGFPMCTVVWTWDSIFYGASDFTYNALTIAGASMIGATGLLASLKYGWGLLGLWTSMVYAYFGVRLVAHYFRFNSASGPFGRSTAVLKQQEIQEQALATEHLPPQ